jgi:predicted membrane protein
MKHNSGSLVIGFLLVLFGMSILFDNLHIPNVADLIWKFWPVILIYIGIRKLSAGKWIWGTILFAVGAMCLVGNFGPFKFDIFGMIFAMLIVVAGIKVLSGAFGVNPVNSNTTSDTDSSSEDRASVSKEKQIEEVAIFASNSKQFNNDNFKGGSSVAIFGETKLDLAHCKIAKTGADLEIVSVFGNTQVFVPENMNVKIEMVPILGETTDQRQNIQNIKDQGTLYIKAVAVFGGVQLKNSKAI